MNQQSPNWNGFEEIDLVLYFDIFQSAPASSHSDYMISLLCDCQTKTCYEIDILTIDDISTIDEYKFLKIKMKEKNPKRCTLYIIEITFTSSQLPGGSM